MNQKKIQKTAHLFGIGWLFIVCLSTAIGADESASKYTEDEISSDNVIRAESFSNKELADAVASYVSAVEKGDWEKAYLLRSKRFQALNPVSIYTNKIASMPYAVNKYEVLHFYNNDKWCRLIVRIRDSFAHGNVYSVAWWGKTARGWVCIDDGTMIFPFFAGGLSNEQLTNLLGEE